MATQRGSDASNTASRSTKATAPMPQHQRPPLVAAANAGKKATPLLVSFLGWRVVVVKKVFETEKQLYISC